MMRWRPALLNKIQRRIAAYIVCARGSMAIEAALVLPVFLAFVLGIILLSHAVMVKQNMLYSLDVAARQLMLDTSASAETLENVARARMKGFNADAVSFSVTDQSEGGVDSKVLSASYTYNLSAIIGIPSVTMTSTVRVPVD